MVLKAHKTPLEWVELPELDAAITFASAGELVPRAWSSGNPFRLCAAGRAD